MTEPRDPIEVAREAWKKAKDQHEDSCDRLYDIKDEIANAQRTLEVATSKHARQEQAVEILRVKEYEALSVLEALGGSKYD